MAASRRSSRRAIWSRWTRSVVRVNSTRQPFSTRAKPSAAARWLLPPPGGPNNSKLAPLFSQASPAANAMTWALLITGTASKSKLSRVFPGGNRASARWRSSRRRLRSAISCSANAARKRPAGRPAFLVGLSGKGSPDQFYGGQPQLGEQQLDAGSVAGIGRSSCRTNQLDSAELVIKLQRRHLDGDVGNGGWMWREAPAERVEIGQSSGLEFGVDGPGELGFAGAIMSERQQSDDRAARLLFAVTSQQRFEGAPVGAAREELVTIDQIEQGHWLAAQGMDDVPVIDDVAMLSAGMRPPAAQRRQRRRAEEAFEAVVPRVRLRRPEDRLRAARAAGGRSGATATNRKPS